MNASPTLRDLEFFGNGATWGGCISIQGGAPDVQDCRFEGNVAELGGAACYVADGFLSGSGLEVLDHELTGDQAYGGGIYVGPGATALIQDSDFRSTEFFFIGGGGGVYTHPASLGTRIEDCEFREHGATDFNMIVRGGAIQAEGPLEANDCRFEDNGSGFTTRGGGAMGGSYSRCVFRGNVAQNGGGASNIVANECVFVENSACADGSGAGGGANSSTLSDCLFVNNFACGRGGGASDSTLVDCEVRFNSVGPPEGGFAEGGGLDDCTAEGTLIRGNFAFGTSSNMSRGGGASSSDLTRCVVASNWACSGGGTTATNTTATSLVGNGAEELGGVRGGTHDSSLVWHNTPATDGGSASFLYCNLESGLGDATNLSLDPLVFGPTGSDVRLMPGSPCIDAGNPSAPLDLDGTRRDIGAFPFDPAAVFTSGTYCQPSDLPTGPLECVSQIGVQGTASFQDPDPVLVTAREVQPGSFALLFHGRTSAFQVLDLGTLSAGFLCVGSPQVREAVLTSTAGAGTCSGTLTQELTDSRLAMLGYVPGDRLHAQFWIRIGPGKTSLTDAAEILILP